MKISKRVIKVIILTCMMMFLSAFASSTVELKPTALLAYRDWKNHTRQEIQKKIHFLEQKMADQKDKKKQTDDNLTSELRSEKIRLEASEDLSFHEYFLSYLTEQKDLDLRISELAKMLKPDEIKELISSYATFIKQKKGESDKQGYATDPLEN